MRVSVSGRENADPRRSYVIVCNHQSHADVLALYGWLDLDFKWVMKQELRRVPGLGVGCEKLGHIFIDRSNRQAALASINAARERLVAGTSVLFFAEGTRSADGRLGAFKKGAFRFAIDSGLPILPVTTAGTAAILPARTRRLRPGRARITIHPPVEVAGLGEGDMPRLMEQVRGIIASALPVESRPLA
jgi:1-acyl-sn-glycerol-3-phosphate acyltransferase